MDELKCLHCGAILEEDYRIDLLHEGDCIISTMLGYCPECETEYTWDEEYTYSKSYNLKEYRK